MNLAAEVERLNREVETYREERWHRDSHQARLEGDLRAQNRALDAVRSDLHHATLAGEKLRLDLQAACELLQRALRVPVFPPTTAAEQLYRRIQTFLEAGAGREMAPTTLDEAKSAPATRPYPPGSRYSVASRRNLGV